MSLPKSSKRKTTKKKAPRKRKKVAELRMSEPSTRGNGMYTPTIQVGLKNPLTLGMDVTKSWGKYKPLAANK